MKRRHHHLKQTAGSVAGALSLLLGTQTFAQSTASDEQPATGAAEGASEWGTLTEIVVTAQRRVENSQKAAVPMNVLTSDAMLEAGITDPARLSDIVPGLAVTPSAGGVRFFFLRGAGNFTATSFSDPTIAVNYDGVYVGRSTATSGLFYDLSRIEVLNGPQGTLYGRNATGGVINVIPAPPVAGELSGYVDATYGNYDAFTVEGAVNLPVRSEGALRISGSMIDRDGFQTDGTGDEQRESLRVQFATELTPDLNIKLAGDYVHLGGFGLGANPDTTYAFAPGSGTFVPSSGGLDENIGLYDPRAQAFRMTLPAGPAGRTEAAIAPFPAQDNVAVGAQAEINWAFDPGTLTLLPAWRSNDIDSRSIGAGYTVDLDEKDDQLSFEARFASERIGMFDYTLGALYYEEEQGGRYAVNLQAVGIYQEFHGDTESYAGFGRLTAHLDDRLRLVGGIRHTRDKKTLVGETDNLTIACTVAVNGVPSCPTAPLLTFAERLEDVTLPIPPVRGAVLPIGNTGAIMVRMGQSLDSSLENSRTTYRGAIEFDAAPESLLYASVETGYRSGGFSFAQGYETFDPEYITAYTAGSKNRFLDDRLQVNLELFWWKYRDLQIAHFGLDLTGTSANFTENIGRSTTKGVDLSVQMLATPSTTLSTQIQYLDTKYDEFAYEAPSPVGQILTGCPQAPSTANPGLIHVDCSGFPGYNAPEWTINFGGQQQLDVGAYRFTLAADTQYRSSRYVGFEYLDADRVGSTWQSNARLAFGPQDDSWAVEGYVRNIENDRYSLSKFLDTVSNALYSAAAAPRTYGVRVAARF